MNPSSNLVYKRTYVRSYTGNQLSDDFLKKSEEAKSEGTKPDEGINPAQYAETIAKRS